jgi:sugar phosphate isomerase/epimerase
VTLAARYAVCERALRQGSFAADVALARAAGIAGIGVDADAVDAIGVAEAARVLAGEGVRASSYMSLPDILASGSLGDVARRLDVAAQLGAPGALVATGPLAGHTVADADARVRDWLTSAGSIASACGVRVMLEPLHPLLRRWSYVHTFEHAHVLVDGIDGTGIVVDVGHLWWERDLDRLLRTHVEAIVSVQLTNVDPTALDELRYDRAPFETGEVPITALAHTLEAAGYTGWYENEVLMRVPRDQRLAWLRASRAWFTAL